MLVLWGVWAKFVAYQITQSDDEIGSIMLKAEKIFLNPLDEMTAFLNPVSYAVSPSFWMSAQLTVFTGVIFAINNMAISRAVAAMVQF